MVWGMDYQELLRKYIVHVGDQEGTDFIPEVDTRRPGPFTREELVHLNRLSRLPNAWPSGK